MQSNQFLYGLDKQDVLVRSAKLLGGLLVSNIFLDLVDYRCLAT